LWKTLKPVIDKEGIEVLFTQIEQVIKEADIAFGFLNCSISKLGEKRQGVKIGTRAPAELARGLAASGFDLFSLATPHIFDYGPEAVDGTINLLEWYGINPIGAGTDLKSAKEPAILTVIQHSIVRTRV